ncbi:MAG: GNAT family N-acetyltransferase [Anaerolineales bacterium]|nr:GNAT family N-acetyltransferase [Anaerolineales bacterium]
MTFIRSKGSGGSDQPETALRSAAVRDRRAVQRLTRSDSRAHRHLGWIPPLEWLGRDPFLILTRGQRVLAALACPPDEDQRVWLRLFAAAEDRERAEAWDALWPRALDMLRKEEGKIQGVNVLVLQGWLEPILRSSGFEQTAAVVTLDWDAAVAPQPPALPLVEIQPLTERHLDAVYRVDSSCFAPIWRNTRRQLRRALRESALAEVALDGGEVVGYQLSTAGTMAGHLARLAVVPEHRGQGIGKALVAQVLDGFQRLGMVRVTVNTQADNASSLEIYRQFGFVRGEETYPVYDYRLHDEAASVD